MMVEDIHIIELHALQRLIERCHQILTGAPVTVRAVPHGVACLRGDDHLITVRTKIRAHDLSEVLLRGARLRAVVVRQVEVGDAVIKCRKQHRLHHVHIGFRAEVVPETQGHLRKLQSRFSTAPVKVSLIAVTACCGHIFLIHRCILLFRNQEPLLLMIVYPHRIRVLPHRLLRVSIKSKGSVLHYCSVLR